METNQLTFEHICFKYKGNDNQLFTDLDVTMETGQVVGILGASGSGETPLRRFSLVSSNRLANNFVSWKMENL